MWFLAPKKKGEGFATLPTVRSELQIVRTLHDFTLDESTPEDLRVHCASCGTELNYDPDFIDRKLSKFRCHQVDDDYITVKGCEKEWSEAQVDRMSAAEIGAVFFTALKFKDEPVFRFVIKSNGVTKYTATEEMTHLERVEYYQKALRERRKKH